MIRGQAPPPKYFFLELPLIGSVQYLGFVIPENKVGKMTNYNYSVHIQFNKQFQISSFASYSVVFLRHCVLYKFTYLLTYLLTYLILANIKFRMHLQ